MPTFPGTVTPSVWYDGNQPAYTDSGATALAGIGDRVRRINEPSPLTGAWTSPSDDERPYRDSNSLRFEGATPAGDCRITRPAIAGLTANACTFVCTYVARDNAYAGPVEGVFESFAGEIGVRIGSNQIWVFYSGNNFFPGLQIAQGKENTIGVRYTPTGIDVWLDVPGQSRQTQTLTASIPATSVTNGFTVGFNQGNQGPMYGSCSQMFGVPRSLTDLELDGCMVWSAAQTIPLAYPDDRSLIVWVGDSIQRATGASYGLCYPFLSLAAVRAAGYPAENCDVAVGGTGVPSLIDPTVSSPNSNLLRRGLTFYSPTRAHNVMVICLGTNDLANGNGPTFTVFGTGLGIPGSGLFPACDYARAAGFKVVLMTIGPRNSTSVSQAQYNADRAAANNLILTQGLAHADLVVDTTQITHWGFDNDPLNATYYSGDLIHPVNAGHALVAPSVSTALIRLLSAPAIPPGPVPPTIESRLWPSIRISSDRRGILT